MKSCCLVLWTLCTLFIINSIIYIPVGFSTTVPIKKVQGILYRDLMFRQNKVVDINFYMVLCNKELVLRHSITSLHIYLLIKETRSKCYFLFCLFNWLAFWNSLFISITPTPKKNKELVFLQFLMWMSMHKVNSNTSRMSNILVIWANRSTRWFSDRRCRSSLSKVWS